jgi:hypothetical protein
MLPASSRQFAERSPANENTMQCPTSATRRSAWIKTCGNVGRPIASTTGVMSLMACSLKASAFMVSSRMISGRLAAPVKRRKHRNTAGRPQCGRPWPRHALCGT